jgi:MarR family transcriptional regulator, organic hydroperoxide resistance regulator
MPASKSLSGSDKSGINQAFGACVPAARQIRYRARLVRQVISIDKTDREMPKAKKVGSKLSVEARSVGIKAPAAEGGESAFREFMSDIFAAAATMQTLRRATAKPFGLSSTELAVMMAVVKLNCSPSIRRIADHLHVSASNVTADVGKLVKARLLTKLPDSEDARAIKVAVTDKGTKLIRDMAPALRVVNDRLFANMSRSDIAILTRLLRQIIVEGGRLAQIAATSDD